MKLLLNEKLEELLLRNWANFLDKTQFLKSVLEYARNSEYPKVTQSDIPAARIQATITKFRILSNQELEIWVEFSVPNEKGVTIGTHVCNLNLNGELRLDRSYGTIFESES